MSTRTIERIEAAEVTLNGLTFIVDYIYTPADPGDYYNPPVPDEVELLAVSVKGQPDADADSILAAMKSNVRVRETGGGTARAHWTPGSEELEDEILQRHPAGI